MQKIKPCLWFDDRIEEAVKFYTGLFKNSRILETSHYPDGRVLVIVFEIDGEEIMALNGGPEFKFNEALSLQIYCTDQEEIDYYWEKLGAGGDPKAQVCGWLKDRYGVSWQVVPENMDQMFKDEKSPSAQRVMEAMLKMKKLDIATLQRAYDGADQPVGAGSR